MVAGAAGLLAGLPAVTVDARAPGELLWRFRLSSLATQGVLWGATAVVLGLLVTAATRIRTAA